MTEKELEELTGEFCDKYCKFPPVCSDEETLVTVCKTCPMNKMFELLDEIRVKGRKKMTTQEAIKGLKNLFSKHELDLPYQVSLEISHIAIKSMKKQIPKKPMVNKFKKDIEVICPNCNEKRYFVDTSEGDKYCPNCGQALDWSGVN